MTPRPLDPEQWPQVVDLLHASGLPTSDLSPDHADRFCAITEAGRVVGCVAVERYGDWGLLRSLAVAPEMRGRGLGTVLVSAALDLARQEEMTDLALLTETAEAFFRSLGWRTVSRSEVPEDVRRSSEFQGICCESAACLVRPVVEGTSVSPA